MAFDADPEYWKRAREVLGAVEQRVRAALPGERAGVLGEALVDLVESSPGIDKLIATMPLSTLSTLADAAVDALRVGRHPYDSQAGSAISQLSFQAPRTLRSHVDELWDLRQPTYEPTGWSPVTDGPFPSTYFEPWPWRAVEDADEVAALSSRLGDSDPETANRAWECLLESRTVAGWQAAYDAWNVTIPDGPVTRNYFYEVGLDITEDGYRRVVHQKPAHLLLPHGYLASNHDHPTWSLDTAVVGQGRFGGSCEAPCAVCGGTLQRLVAFDQKPSGVDLPDEIVTCQSCLGWSEEILFFEHESGLVRPAPVPVTTQEPQFRTETIPETTIVFR
ncbi:MAG: hypothetical protein ACR2PK_17200 [Acidimicrobiales bacterium]